MKFSAPELRELGRLQNATVVIDPVDLDLDAESAALVETSRDAATAVKVFRAWSEDAAARPPAPRRRAHRQPNFVQRTCNGPDL